VAEPAAQVDKYLRMLGLWERADEAAGTFSKGMRQKLAIARALMHEPRVVFLDEPTAGLDPEAAKLVRDFIGELKQEGRTIFLCTHNLDEADRLCDRVAVFNAQLRVVDTPAGLRRQMYGRQVVFHMAHPATPYADAVRALPYIKRIEALDNKLVLALDEPEKHNPEIIGQLVAGGAQLQFVGELRHSLEDVYLQLIHNEAYKP
jgi:ABC-2 type transport system ATP-binding protein